MKRIPRRALRTLPLAALLALVLAGPARAADAPGSIGAAAGSDAATATRSSGEARSAAHLVGPKPQLLLFHGGSFLFDDPYFEPLTRGRALAAGFVPHYVNYPLGDIGAAVTAARTAARNLREQVGRDRVFAYGASAGGTLAAILDGEGDVDAAVAKAPVSDLADWEWPLGRYGANYYETIMAPPSARLRLSPTRRPERRPLLVIQGSQDNVVPPSMNEAFAAKFPRVHLWVVPGGHTTERVRPWLVTRAMQWLAQIAAQHTVSEGAEVGG